MNINGYFIYNGVDTRTLGVDVSRGVAGNILRRPVREYQVSQPPGRLGDIIQDNRHFPNVEIAYHVMIPDNFDAVYRQLRGALLGATGYARLEDSWNTEEFYQAYVSAPLQPTVSANRRQGMLEVTFGRRPERWLKSGDMVRPARNTGVVYSGDIPTKYTFFPKITMRCAYNITSDYYPRGLSVIAWYTQPTDSTIVNAGDVTLYKPATKRQNGTNVIVYWTEYFVSGDTLVFDFAAGTLTNTTQGTDLSHLLPDTFTEGIRAPGEYQEGKTGLFIYSSQGAGWFVAVDFTPRWYSI